MNKLDVYMFLSITGVLSQQMKLTKFLTFSSYCNYLLRCINQKDLSVKEMNTLLLIKKELTVIYNLSDSESSNKIIDYLEFGNDKLLVLYRCVLEDERFFNSPKINLL